MPKTKTTLLSVTGVLSLALLTSGAVVVAIGWPPTASRRPRRPPLPRLRLSRCWGPTARSEQ